MYYSYINTKDNKKARIIGETEALKLIEERCFDAEGRLKEARGNPKNKIMLKGGYIEVIYLSRASGLERLNTLLN